MENAYKTMDTEYSESIMWAFKQLYEKGLLYEDFRILPYSWSAETPLSNFEVNQAYKDKTDNTATVKFKLTNGLTLLGGEPMEPANQTALLPFVKKVKEIRRLKIVTQRI